MATTPSLVLFGPLTYTTPTKKDLDDLRLALKTEPALAYVLHLLEQPQAFWEAVRPASPFVPHAQGLESVTQLAKLLTTGEETGFRHDTSSGPKNALILPLTILLQISSFLAYCISTDRLPEDVIDAANAQGGVQGCCAGLLSALAVTSGRDENGISVNAARAMHLAFVVGLLIDADCARQKAETSFDHVTLALRWRPGVEYALIPQMLAVYKGAYIAMRRDEREATIVVPQENMRDLMATFVDSGVTSFDTKLRGRYHSAEHKDMAKAILDGLPWAKMPLTRDSTRCNTTGNWLALDDPTLQVVNCMLSETADWYAVVSQSLTRCRLEESSFVLTIGADSMPVSLSKSVKVASCQDLGHRLSNPYSHPEHCVAVIGMSCRFPGAQDLEEFWEMLVQGRSMLSRMPQERFDPDSTYTRAPKDMKFWGNFLDDIASFDHKFFKRSPREAASMDPQQRVLLHVAYEALASAGYFANEPSNKRKLDVGCYIGACSTDYDHNVMSHVPTAYSTTGTLRAFLSGKISHFFGFSGPSLTFDTACSSSAVAIHSACVALRAGEVSQALAGGATIHTSPYLYENLAAAHFLSPTGATKPFDADADGYCRGEGVGLVLLKRLDDALRDGDFIRGVIVSSAVNQNANCVPITVPHSISQADLYRRAATRGGLEGSDLSFVEAHGTGTPVGDPIEIESIRKVFGGTRRKHPLYVTSVKGNIGHLEGASGIAALIKAVLQMEHRTIPMQASFKTLNSNITDLDKDNVKIPTANVPIPDQPITACVNNYGAAGSNAALLIAESPPALESANSAASVFAKYALRYPVLLTASHIQSLKLYCQRLSSWLQRHQDRPIDGHSLAVNIARHSNNDLQCALTLSFADANDLKAQLSDIRAIESNVVAGSSARPVVLALGGQVSDRVRISRTLWEMRGPFRTHLDRCDRVLRAKGFPSIYPAVFQDEAINDVIVLHSALFASQYATAMAWLDSGVDVAAIVGHSFGQLSALAISGSLSLEDAIQLVAGRARLMAQRWGDERGTMVLVDGDVSAVHEAMTQASEDGLHSYEIACYNDASSHVVVCTQTAATALEKVLISLSIRHKRLRVPYGFHSKFTEPILEEYLTLARSLHFTSGSILVETCSEIEPWTTPTPELVVDHTRKPVYFAAAVRRVEARFGGCIWLEAGSDSGVVSMARRVLGSHSKHTFVPLQLHGPLAFNVVADATRVLWQQKVHSNFWFYHHSARKGVRHVDLPTYAWDYAPHWLELKHVSAPADGPNANVATASQEAPPKLPLLTLLPPITGSGAAEHQIRISLQSDDYRGLVKSFDKQTSSATWTSMLLDIISRALALFNIDIGNVSVQKFSTDSPALVLNLKQDPILRLVAFNDGWQFAIISHVNGLSTVICDGIMDTRDRRSTLIADFARYHRLAGPDAIDRIQSSTEAECLQGNVVYNMFSKVGVVPKEQRVVKAVRALMTEAVGRISLEHDAHATSMRAVDAFLQVAAVHANCLRHDIEPSDVYELRSIQQISWAPSPIATSKDWNVLCSHVADSKEGSVTYDLFIYDMHSGALSLLILGAAFLETMNRTPQVVAGNGLEAALPIVEQDISNPAPALSSRVAEAVQLDRHLDVPKAPALSNQKAIYSDICDILEELAEVPRNQVIMSSTFDSLGVDSLMMMEVISDLSRLFKVELPIEDLEQLTDVESLITYLDGRGCISTQAGEPPSISSLHPSTPSSSLGLDGQDDSSTATMTTVSNQESKSPMLKQAIIDGDMASPAEIFSQMRENTETYLAKTGFAEFWTNVYPSQRDLVLAYVVECFRGLGCDLDHLHHGETLAEIVVLPKHVHLRDRQHEILVDGGLIEPRADGSFVRSAKPVDPVTASNRFEHMLEKFPQHAAETRLLNVTGSRLANCMTGKEDPLALLFANRQNRGILADVYENAPMCRATTQILADYLFRLLSSLPHGQTAHILEVGAGTGGTARYVVEFLKARSINFEYTFTDISSALVTQAKKRFSAFPEMRFRVFDCDIEPEDELLGKFDVVIATNCVHATKNVSTTARNILQVLRAEGVFCLVEFTRPLYWFDLVYGLLEGWWLFEDGRKHALADETVWYRALIDAEYSHVSWTDGRSQEAQTMRLIVASRETDKDIPLQPVLIKRAGFSIQEVTWGMRAGVELAADIYLPKAPDPEGTKRPVALLFHGGGHLLFGRKDIPMKHVRELLKRGFMPVSVDYRLCPEVCLYEGPYADCCDALRWVREKLPSLKIAQQLATPDPRKLISIGWSSGGQLAMSVGFTGPQRGVEPPSAVFALYSPTDLEHEHWSKPCYPLAAEEAPQEVTDLLAGVKDHQIVEYTPLNKRRQPCLSLTLGDDRARIILHMNWTAQTLPVLLRGLPSRTKLEANNASLLSVQDEKWKHLPPPSLTELQQASPMWHIRNRTYAVPTFMVHGNKDDWLPHSMSEQVKKELCAQGVAAELIVADQCGHAFDLFPVEDPSGQGWAAVEKGYDWICRTIGLL